MSSTHAVKPIYGKGKTIVEYFTVFEVGSTSATPHQQHDSRALAIADKAVPAATLLFYGSNPTFYGHFCLFTTISTTAKTSSEFNVGIEISGDGGAVDENEIRAKKTIHPPISQQCQPPQNLISRFHCCKILFDDDNDDITARKKRKGRFQIIQITKSLK